MREQEIFGVGRRLLLALVLAAMLPDEGRAGPATQLFISNDTCLGTACPPHPPPPPIARSGEGFGVVVLALTASSGADNLYTGTIAFSSSDPNATLPPPYTFVLADAGVRGFTVILRTPGQQTITVMDASGVLTPATLTMTVTATLPSVGIPTLAAWMQVALALLLGLAGVWLFRAAN